MNNQQQDDEKIRPGIRGSRERIEAVLGVSPTAERPRTAGLLVEVFVVNADRHVQVRVRDVGPDPLTNRGAIRALREAISSLISGDVVLAPPPDGDPR